MREKLLAKLNITVNETLEFVSEIKNIDFMVYSKWSAKDVIGHLTFWHESFARNVKDLKEKRTPNPLKGKLGDLNEIGVSEMRKYLLNEILERMKLANKTINKSILSPEIGLVPYRKGSRSYSPEEHLEIVEKHILKHLKDIKKAIKELNVRER